MKTYSVQNYSVNPNRTPQFNGTVSPEYIKYVNTLRDKCLAVAAPKNVARINKTCDDIIAKSERIMGTCFPSESELSINTEKSADEDIIVILNNTLEKFFGMAVASNAGFVDKEECNNNPFKRLKGLKFWINNGLTFAEAFSKELLVIKNTIPILKGINEYKGNGKKFDDVLGLCNWWKGHMGLLQKNVTSEKHDFTKTEKFLDKLISEITQQEEYLKSNTISYTLREGHSDTVTDNLFGHLREMLGMPSDEVIYDGRKTDWEMEKFLDELLPPVLRRKDLSQEELDNLLNWNIKPIEGTKNSFRGPAEYCDIEQLKPNNLEFVNAEYVYNHLWDGDTEELVEFIKTMQKGNVYVGCQFGQKQTNFVLLANQFFNPMSKDTRDYGFNSYSTCDVFEDLCDALTPEQKKDMGWTEEFETKFRQKLKAKREWLYEFDEDADRYSNEQKNDDMI